MGKFSKASLKKIWWREKEFFIAGMSAGYTEYGIKMFWLNSFHDQKIILISSIINIFTISNERDNLFILLCLIVFFTIA
jgi:hypothetical protein